MSRTERITQGQMTKIRLNFDIVLVLYLAHLQQTKFYIKWFIYYLAFLFILYVNGSCFDSIQQLFFYQGFKTIILICARQLHILPGHILGNSLHYEYRTTEFILGHCSKHPTRTNLQTFFSKIGPNEILTRVILIQRHSALRPLKSR